MTIEDKRLNKRRVLALDDHAAQLVAALVVDGAVLDDGLVLRHVTAGFASRFGQSTPKGISIIHCIEDQDSRAQLICMSEASNARLNVAGLDVPFSARPPSDQDWPYRFGPVRDSEGEDRCHDNFIEVRLFQPDMNVRISPLTVPGGLAYGFLVQEIPDIGISSMPERNAGRVAPAARGSAQRVLAQLSNAYWESCPVTGEFSASELWYTIRGHQARDADIEDHENWTKRVHPEDRAALFDYQRKLQTGDADFVPVIYRERHADGHWMTILCKGAVIERDSRGAVLRVAGTDADITASHSTEEYIRDIAVLEQRWLIAAEYGQLGLWDNDEATGTRYVSQTWRKMRGYGPDDAFDESRAALAERTHPDDRSALERQINATVNGETEIVFQEYRERHRDGHWIWVLSRGRVIARNAQGSPTRIIGIDTDITEIKAASEKNYRMSQRLEVAIEATRVGIWDADFARSEVIWDARMMNIYGLELPPGPIPDNYWENAIHPDDRARVMAQTAEVEAGEIAFAEDYRVVRPDGTVRYIRSRSTKVFDGSVGHGLIGEVFLPQLYGDGVHIIVQAVFLVDGPVVKFPGGEA